MKPQSQFPRSVSAIGLALGIALLTTACAPAVDGGSVSSDEVSSDSVSEGARGSLTLWVYSDPSGFNPALAAGVQTFQFDRLLYDTVLRLGEDGIVGGLAADWTASSASDYIFTIREDATCSDGTPITATVVADSLKYLSDPETGSPWSPLVFGNATPTIVANDEAATVSITLSEPFASLEAGLTVAQTGVVCPAGLADLEGLEVGSVEGAFSGPYALTESNPGIGYTLSFRDGYSAWPDYSVPLEGSPAKEIVYTLGNDESTAANQMLAGQIDFGNYAEWDTIARFDGEDGFSQNLITAYTTYIVFNQRPGRIFADNPELRKAVAQSINQEGFNTVFSQGNAELLTSVVPGSYECANTDSSWMTAYDPEAAKKLLDGTSGIKLHGNTANLAFSNGADFVYESLTAAGADVDLTKVDNASYWTIMRAGGDAWDVTFIGDQNAAQAISASLDRSIGPAIEDNGRNFSGSINPEGEAALTAGLATADLEERCNLFLTAQKSLFDRYDVVPLAGGSTVTIISDKATARQFGEDVDVATLRLVD